MSTLLLLSDIEKSLKQTLDDNKEEILKSEYPEDLITEYVDSEIPVYHNQLLELAQNDFWLATYEPEIMAFDGKNTAINAIAGNVYQHLREIGNQWLEDNRVVEE